ncbi:MAG: hypothetical protein ACRELY_20490 [Polyangiaceae bacterium]
MAHRFVWSLAFVLVLVATASCADSGTSSGGGGGAGVTSCGAGTVEQNGVCVVPYTPPPGKNLGSGATIYFWASASAGGEAVGKIYAIVDGYTQGEMTGYATSGNPTCGTNAIFSVAVSVAPGQSYAMSAHDEQQESWTAVQSPVMTAGQCFSFGLN